SKWPRWRHRGCKAHVKSAAPAKGARVPSTTRPSPLLAVLERAQSFGRALRMHRLPDGEISLELDVRVGSRKRLWARDCIDDAMVDHFDDALAAPQILGKGGSRSCCVGPDSHFATGGATSRCLRAEPAAGLCSRGHFSLACKAPPHRAPPRFVLDHRRNRQVDPSLIRG